MKRITKIPGIILLILAGVSCSDDFLEKNNAELYALPDTLIMDRQNYEAIVMFELPEKINGDFTVFMRPNWINVDDPTGPVRAGRIEFSLSLDGSRLPEGYYSHTGLVVLKIENFGFVSFTVLFTEYGSPTIQCTPPELVFDGTLTQNFALKTPSTGLLDWTITNIPDWVAFSVESGILYQGQEELITVTLDPGKITPGTEMNATVTISSPHVQYPYLLKITVTSEPVPPPPGFSLGTILADAEYHYESGILAVCTRAPDQLILINTYTGVQNTIPLNKTPMCISLAEDGHKAILGYTVASVSYVDLDEMKIIDDYEIDCIPYDIVMGDNGLCYFTPFKDQWVTMRCFDLNSGQLTSGSNPPTVYEKTQIKKVPGKSVIVGSSLPLSPSGLRLYDLTPGPPREEVTHYHESIGHFWISKDGERVYSAYGNIYNIPEYDGQDHSTSPPFYGTLNIEPAYITALDDCPSLNSVFFSTAPSWHEEGRFSLITQYNSTSLNQTKKYNLSDVRININGNLITCETTPRYIFVNKQGTSMHVLKVLSPQYNTNGWLLETISLQ